MTEAEVKIALSRRHKNDFYITNVKTGESWCNPNLRILDAWAMRKSWSNPLWTGYEIKCGRGDFLQDKKWEEYLPYCNEFYFACPTGLIKPDELPEGIGLIYVNPEFHTLRTIKKAKYRQIDYKSDHLIYFLIYIFMNKVDPDRIPFFTDEAQHWKLWLENRRDNQVLAIKVKSQIAWTIRALAGRYERLFRSYNRIINHLQKLHIDLPKYLYDHAPLSMKELDRYRLKELKGEK